MKQLIEFIRRDTCPECNTHMAIECFDVYGNAINYTVFLNEYEKNKNVLERLNKRVLSHMKCKKCNTIFQIYWDSDREIPIPMNKHLSNFYFDEFLKIYK